MFEYLCPNAKLLTSDSIPNVEDCEDPDSYKLNVWIRNVASSLSMSMQGGTQLSSTSVEFLRGNQILKIKSLKNGIVDPDPLFWSDPDPVFDPIDWYRHNSLKNYHIDIFSSIYINHFLYGKLSFFRSDSVIFFLEN